jgi:NADP-dependent 3-hydroxy acid dehydrogenase YdfG
MEDGRGHVVNLGSWAGREAYPAGGMYVGSKTAVRALTYVLRKELVGRIRVTTVDPGMVGGTEFSDVRFAGDSEKKDAVYRGVDFLTPDDVADCILWAVTRPGHMNVDEIVVKPLQQASQDAIVRR